MMGGLPLYFYLSDLNIGVWVCMYVHVCACVYVCENAQQG